MVPVVERLDAEELEERIEFFDTVLPALVLVNATERQPVYSHGRTGETPPVLAFQGTTADGTLSLFVLDVVSFICDRVNSILIEKSPLAYQVQFATT